MHASGFARQKPVCFPGAKIDNLNMSWRVILFLVLAGLGCLLLVGLRPPRPAPASRPPARQPPLAASADPAGPDSNAFPNTTFSPPLMTNVPAPAHFDNGASELTAAILQGLNSTNDDERALVFSDLLPALVALDAPAAGKLAESLAPATSRDQVLSRVAQIWAGKDPAGALAWAAQLSDTNELRSTLADVLFRMAQADPVKAIAAAQQYPASVGEVMASVAQQWADKDLPAALAWAGNQPAGTQRDQIMARIAFVESKTAPEAAGTLIVTQMQPGAIQNEAAISVLYQWIQTDFDAASAWVNQFPESPLKARALAELEGYRIYHPKPSARCGCPLMTPPS